MDKLNFLTAGIPISTPGKRTIPNGLDRIHTLGLHGVELEYVRGVHYDPVSLSSIRAKALDLNLILSAHAPYYINLNALEKNKIDNSYRYILDTARVLETVGGYSLVFHAGYYLKEDKNEVYSTIRNHLKNILSQIKKESIRVWIRPETMGKHFQFGTIQEIIDLTHDLGHPVLPCLDLSHIHARTTNFNSYNEWHTLLKTLEKELGRYALDEMHIHYSGIQYSQQGEIRHLILRKSDARYRELLRILKDFDCKGILVCESPNVEGDCLMLKKIYDSME